MALPPLGQQVNLALFFRGRLLQDASLWSPALKPQACDVCLQGPPGMQAPGLANARWALLMEVLLNHTWQVGFSGGRWSPGVLLDD